MNLNVLTSFRLSQLSESARRYKMQKIPLFLHRDLVSQYKASTFCLKFALIKRNIWITTKRERQATKALDYVSSHPASQKIFNAESQKELKPIAPPHSLLYKNGSLCLIHSSIYRSQKSPSRIHRLIRRCLKTWVSNHQILEFYIISLYVEKTRFIYETLASWK